MRILAGSLIYGAVGFGLIYIVVLLRHRDYWKRRAIELEDQVCRLEADACRLRSRLPLTLEERVALNNRIMGSEFHSESHGKKAGGSK